MSVSGSGIFAELLNLLAAALPDDLHPDELLEYGKPEWKLTNPRLAVAYALRKHPRLNWVAYAANNPEVEKTGADSVLHFLDRGIYEGRKLYSWHPFHKPWPADAPEVSVIIPNYNNEDFLEKCLRSVTGQTLSNIEIIVVDDASTDGSVEIIERFAAADARIRILRQPVNSGLHMARKAGVAAAAGKYAMFLDSDDFYNANACEKAVRLIKKGYDIVQFELNAIRHNRLDPLEEPRTHWSRRLPDGCYSGREKLALSFAEDKMPNFLPLKIFERSFAQRCFEEMADGSFIFEDMYESLFLNYYARTVFKSSEVLYNYAIGIGMSTQGSSANYVARLTQNLAVLGPFKIFCDRKCLPSTYTYFKRFILNIAVSGISDCSPDALKTIFSILNDFFGASEITVAIKRTYYKRYGLVAKKLAGLAWDARDVKKILMITRRISVGGIETNIRRLCDLLIPLGYEFTLVLYEPSEYDARYRDIAKIFYLPPPYSAEQIDEYLAGLAEILTEVKPDLLFDWQCRSRALLWEAVLCRMLGINIISRMAINHNWDNTENFSPFTQAEFLRGLRTLDKTICLDISSEIYLRAHDIDAVYLPNAIEKAEAGLSAPVGEDNVAFVGRFDDPQKGGVASLYILQEILNQAPRVKFIYIGKFEREDRKEYFYTILKRLGLEKHVEMVGWTNQPRKFLAQCKLMLSCAYMEGFPNAIGDAQALGLPVVCYALDIVQAIDNESIIQVPHKDIKRAAREIVRLMRDDAELARLGKIAVEKAGRFTEARYTREMIDLFKNFSRLTPWRPYSIREYQNAVAWQAFYAGKGMPKYEEF